MSPVLGHHHPDPAQRRLTRWGGRCLRSLLCCCRVNVEFEQHHQQLKSRVYDWFRPSGNKQPHFFFFSVSKRINAYIRVCKPSWRRRVKARRRRQERWRLYRRCGCGRRGGSGGPSFGIPDPAPRRGCVKRFWFAWNGFNACNGFIRETVLFVFLFCSWSGFIVLFVTKGVIRGRCLFVKRFLFVKLFYSWNVFILGTVLLRYSSQGAIRGRLFLLWNGFIC